MFFLHQFLQARLVNGHAAGLEQFDFLGVLINANDLMASLRQNKSR